MSYDTATQFASINSYNYPDKIYFRGYYEYSQSDTDKELNQTTLTLYGCIYLNNEYSAYYGSLYSDDDLQIDGTTIGSNYEYYTPGSNGRNLIGSITKVVQHDENGKFPNTTISIYADTHHFNKVSASGTITSADIPDIPRAAKLTVDKTEVSKSSPTTATFTLDPFSSSFKYKIERKIGSGSWTTFKNNYTSSTFTDTYSSITGGTDGNYTAYYRCSTYNSGGSQIGSTSDEVTLKTFFPGDPNPMELYQNGNSLGVAFLNRVDNTPGFYIGGRGPITPINVIIDGVTYTMLGWKVN